MTAQENDGRMELMRDFAQVREDITRFEAKQKEKLQRQARQEQGEVSRKVRDVQRKLDALVDEEERDARATIRISEGKCKVALLRLVEIDRAVIECSAALADTKEKERNRRRFLTHFEEKERKHLEETYGAMLWKPGMKLFGKCPFALREHCPFHNGTCYGLLVDDHHFIDQPPPPVETSPRRRIPVV